MLFSAKTNCAEVASVLRGAMTDLVVEQERMGRLDEGKVKSILESAIARLDGCGKDAWMKAVAPDQVREAMMTVGEFQTILRATLIVMRLNVVDY
jgi:hypothetical protein